MDKLKRDSRYGNPALSLNTQLNIIKFIEVYGTEKVKDSDDPNAPP